jgi:hypothetical protein
MDASDAEFVPWMDAGEGIIVGLLVSAFNLPLCAEIEARQPDRAWELMSTYAGMVEEEMGGDEVAADAYVIESYRGQEIGCIAFRLFVVRIRCFYTILGDRFLLSTKRFVITDLIDRHLERKAGAGASRRPPAVAGNVGFDVHGEAFDRLRVTAGLAWQERMRKACHRNLEPIYALRRYHGVAEADLAPATARLFGQVMLCPAGGTYHYDPEKGQVRCSLHGTRNDPKQPFQLDQTSTTARFLAQLRNTQVMLRFTPEGIRTRISLDLTGTASHPGPEEAEVAPAMH